MKSNEKIHELQQRYAHQLATGEVCIIDPAQSQHFWIRQFFRTITVLQTLCFLLLIIHIFGLSCHIYFLGFSGKTMAFIAGLVFVFVWVLSDICRVEMDWREAHHIGYYHSDSKSDKEPYIAYVFDDFLREKLFRRRRRNWMFSVIVLISFGLIAVFICDAYQVKSMSDLNQVFVGQCSTY